MLGLGTGAGGGRAVQAGGPGPPVHRLWPLAQHGWGRGGRVRPAGRSAALPARGAALCHLVLVVLLRGKERWGDDRGDSGSGQLRRPPSPCPRHALGLPGCGLRPVGLEEVWALRRHCGRHVAAQRPSSTELVGILVFVRRAS